jgi:hypothetical protein
MGKKSFALIHLRQNNLFPSRIFCGVAAGRKIFRPYANFPSILLYGRKIFRPQTFEAKQSFSLKNILRGGSRAKDFSPVREASRVCLRYDLNYLSLVKNQLKCAKF